MPTLAASASPAYAALLPAYRVPAPNPIAANITEYWNMADFLAQIGVHAPTAA